MHIFVSIEFQISILKGERKLREDQCTCVFVDLIN